MMISMFALGSDLPEIEVIRSALSEELKLTHGCNTKIVMLGSGQLGRLSDHSELFISIIRINVRCLAEASLFQKKI